MNRGWILLASSGQEEAADGAQGMQPPPGCGATGGARTCLPPHSHYHYAATVSCGLPSPAPNPAASIRREPWWCSRPRAGANVYTSPPRPPSRSSSAAVASFPAGADDRCRTWMDLGPKAEWSQPSQPLRSVPSSAGGPAAPLTRRRRSTHSPRRPATCPLSPTRRDVDLTTTRPALAGPHLHIYPAPPRPPLPPHHSALCSESHYSS